MILSDDVSDDDSVDDETESDDAIYVELRERGAECTGHATSDDDCCSELERKRRSGVRSEAPHILVAAGKLF
jgi:sugar phosphate isomerase/epimerase